MYSLRRFLVDTGDRFTLTIFPEFFKGQGLHKKYPKRIKTISGYGVGGPVWGELFKLERFTNGSVKLENFPARIPRKVDYSNDFSNGTIGNGLLKARNLVVDYPRKRFIFLETTNSSYQLFDRSGLWLTSSDKAIIVSNVVRGSSAWSSGIRNGDQILEINDTAVNNLLLPELRSRLSDPLVESIKLKVLRGRSIRMFELSLINQI